jgi:hypothetical protein
MTLHVVTSPQQLSLLLHDWSHIDSYRDKLFKFCEEVLKKLDELRQEIKGEGNMVEDEEEEVQTAGPIKLKIPAPKQRVHGGESVDMRSPKRQCRR